MSATVAAGAPPHTRTPNALREYWTHGAGAAKVRWGQPRDYYRCVEQLAKYVHNPYVVKGQCAELHRLALGIWPATHAKLLRGGTSKGHE
jgi:hypothetical protein